MLSRFGVVKRCVGVHPAAPASSIRFKSTEGALDEMVRTFLPPDVFYKQLLERGVRFFTGVPDSLLMDFCAYVANVASPTQHVITANEGSAVALAAGHHMSTGDVPLVYLQNSGLGNTVNPLLSLSHPQVYGIPMMLMIGWRGEPGKKDEPQHRVQGSLTPNLLTSLGINFAILPDYDEGSAETLDDLLSWSRKRSCPVALLVKRQTFTRVKLDTVDAPEHLDMTREGFLEALLPLLGQWDVTVSSTGFLSRELYEQRKLTGVSDDTDVRSDFLTVGSMGHASAIATGIALGKRSRQVVCLDGDGAAIMHLGNMVTAGTSSLTNYKHILINNGCHDSVGGQESHGFNVDFPAIATATGYRHAARAETQADAVEAVKELLSTDGPAFLEVRVRPGARSDLGRPKSTPKDNKNAFMNYLRL